MAQELVILWAGRHDRSPWRELCAEYRRRIERFLPVREQLVKVRAKPQQRRSEEGRSLLGAVPDRAWTIALDPKGETTTSEGLARLLARLRNEWSGPVVFLIGSDLGLPDAVLEAVRQRLSLGSMTLSHELARLVLTEQLYRALAIDRGIKYHRGPIERG